MVRYRNVSKELCFKLISHIDNNINCPCCRQKYLLYNFLGGNTDNIDFHDHAPQPANIGGNSARAALRNKIKRNEEKGFSLDKLDDLLKNAESDDKIEECMKSWKKQDMDKFY